MDQGVLNRLKDYCGQEPAIGLAFLYGSAAKGMQTDESDVDIAVYLKDTTYESRIWQDLSRLLPAEVDLVVLNNAPATLAANVLKTGETLVIKDRGLYWDFYLEKTLESEDFAEFVKDYWRIYQRSRSMIPEDRTRFLQRLEFLTSELAELNRFQQISYQDYVNDRSKRREVERWVENIINATIDMAKIMLASGKQPMPKTYEQVLLNFGSLCGLDEPAVQQLANFVRLRNILADEYLDILYDRIQVFIQEFPKLYHKLSEYLNKFSQS